MLIERIKIEDVPEFNTRIKNAFRRNDIIYLDEAEVFDVYWHHITGIGEKSMKIIYSAIYKYYYKGEKL